MRPLPSIAGLVAVSTLACVEPGDVEREWSAMGQSARARVHTWTAENAEGLLDEIQSGMQRVVAMTDVDDPASALSRLNRESLEDYHTIEDADFFRCVLLSLDYARASRGAFDPTIAPLVRLYGREGGRPPTRSEVELALPRVGWSDVTIATEAKAIRFRKDRMELDLGGIAKGFAIDMAARAFAGSGARAGLVSLGANFYAWEHPPDLEHWPVEVPDPRDPRRILLTVGTANRGVAVSGHPDQARPRVFDPRTGLPASSDLLAAVALADSAADADALATALFVSGSKAGADLMARARRVEAILLVTGGDRPYLLASATLRDRLEPSPELLEEVEGRVRYLLPPQDLEVLLPEPRS